MGNIPSLQKLVLGKLDIYMPKKKKKVDYAPTPGTKISKMGLKN